MQLDLDIKSYCDLFVLTTLIIHDIVLDSSLIIDIEHTGNEKRPHKCNITIYIKLNTCNHRFLYYLCPGNEREFIRELEDSIAEACQAGDALCTQR